MYLTITRPDITCIAYVLGKFMHNLTDVHYQAALRVLSYLRFSSTQVTLLTNRSKATLTANCD